MCEETSVLGGYFFFYDVSAVRRYDVRLAAYDVCLAANDVFLAKKLRVCDAIIIIEHERFRPVGALLFC